MGTTRVSRPIRAPISGAARPSPAPSGPGPGGPAGCSPPPLGRKSWGSVDWPPGVSGLAGASPGPCCGMGFCSVGRWPAQRSSESGWGRVLNTPTEPRLWDNCGARGGGSESMERGKEQVQRRSRPQCRPGRDEAEQPGENLGRSRRTGSQSWLNKSASGFNRMDGFWHRCRGRNGGPGQDGPVTLTRRTRSSKTGPLRRTQAGWTAPLKPATWPAPLAPPRTRD